MGIGKGRQGGALKKLQNRAAWRWTYRVLYCHLQWLIMFTMSWETYSVNRFPYDPRTQYVFLRFVWITVREPLSLTCVWEQLTPWGVRSLLCRWRKSLRVSSILSQVLYNQHKCLSPKWNTDIKQYQKTHEFWEGKSCFRDSTFWYCPLYSHWMWR